MSKMDGLRAMREARYAQDQARAAKSTGSPPRPPQAVAKPAATVTSPDEADVAEDLCGHRNMGGRTCTRERGHAAKSHRYS